MDVEVDEAGQLILSRHISLRVTPDHGMFVREGQFDTDGHFTAGHDDSSLLSRLPASSLLALCDCVASSTTEPACSHRSAWLSDATMSSAASGHFCNCPSDVACDHRAAAVQLLACAESGHVEARSELVCSAVQQRLGLSESQFDVFLQLFGFWLGEGGTIVHTADGDSEGDLKSIRFVVTEQHSVDFLLTSFTTLGIDAALRHSRTIRSAHQLDIVDSRWVALFDAEGSGGPESSKAKVLPRWALLSLSPAQLYRVILGMWRADVSWLPNRAGRRRSVIYAADATLVRSAAACTHPLRIQPIRSADGSWLGGQLGRINEQRWQGRVSADCWKAAGRHRSAVRRVARWQSVVRDSSSR